MLLKKLGAPLLLLLVIQISLPAQNAKQEVIRPVTKFKPPVVQTFLGRNTNGATVTIDEASQLVGLPLKITDEKNNLYAITSYQFLYKKKSVVQNEETGRKEVVFTTVADKFKNTPLPEIWKNTIAAGLQKGEELYYFDILVRDNLNRNFFAPELKIKIN